MRTIRPLKDNVLVKQDAPKEKLASGLFVPQGTRELYDDFGTVLAVGPGRVTEGGEIVPVSVKPGDRVMFKRRPASLINPDARPDGEWYNYLMLKDEDIVGVLDVETYELDTTCSGSPAADTTDGAVTGARECECH